MEGGSTNVLSNFHHGSSTTSEAAFETLFRLHQRAVYRWILRIVRNHAMAEDLTIETFWRIHQSRARFDPARGFEGWARRIATNAALDFLRTERPVAELPEELPARAEADTAITAEIRSRTAEAFRRLPPKLRIAATLAVIEELPHKEVAEALGISVAAVKVRVFRALRLLRNDLSEQGIKP
jgi:RNA polymerase sigma-70 factor (ECF subfamily)